jgi:kynureninase
LTLGAAGLAEEFLAREVRPRFSRALEASRQRGEAYLANHSLGRMPDAAAARVASGLEAWLDPGSAWEAWTAEADRFRANVARLLGVGDPSRVVPKTSAGQGLRAVLNSFPQGRPVRVLSTTEEFDSLDWIMRRYREAGRAEVEAVPPEPGHGVPLLAPGRVVERLKEGFDLLVLSHVYFRTGQVWPDLAGTVAEARASGTRVLVDMYHSAGVLPIHFDAWEVDFAVGGSYKYLRGGPGACFLAVSPSCAALGAETLDTGWFAQSDPMAFDPKRADPAPGGDAWLESTPPVLAPYQANPGIELSLSLDVAGLRAHSLALQADWREAMRRAGLSPYEPADPEAFGAFSLVLRDDAPGFVSALAARGVVVDARGPIVRFCPDVLNSPEELERAARSLKA